MTVTQTPSRGADSPGAGGSAGGIVRRIFSNLGRLVGGKAGAGLISLLYMLIAVRVLGPRDYGVLILVHTFAMTVGGLVEFPGWHAVVRYGALALEAGDAHRLFRLLRFAALVEAAGGACAVVTAAVLGPLLGPHLGWSSTASALALPYSLAVLASIRATPAGYLQLTGRFDLLGLHVLVSPLVRLAGAAAVAVAGGGLRAFLLVWLAAALLESASMWALGVRELRRRAAQRPLRGGVRGVLAENPGLWRFMIGANADATLSDLGQRLAPLIIGWSGGAALAGLYAVAQRATGVISQPAQLLGQAAYAELARLLASGGDGAALRRTLRRAVGAALAFGAPVVLAIGLGGHPLARLIGGHAFRAAGDAMLLLAVARLLLVIAPAASAALVALGRPGLSVAANLAGAVGLAPLLPLLIHRWGLAGAGAHAVLQALVTGSLLSLFVWRASQTRDHRARAGARP